MSGRRRRRKSRRGRKSPGGPDLNNLQGISPKAMQKMLGQIDTKEIDDVVEVIVKTKEEEIVLEQPEVTVMDMGQETWTIIPSSTKRRPLGSSSSTPDATPEKEIEIKKSDVQLIVSTAGVSENEAIEAIKASGGDIAKAIMSLK